jgi:hypothetical protein
MRWKAEKGRKYTEAENNVRTEWETRQVIMCH